MFSNIGRPTPSVDSDSRQRYVLSWVERSMHVGLIMILAIVGFQLFGQFKNYTYQSPDHVTDLIRARLWSLGWLTVSLVGLYL